MVGPAGWRSGARRAAVAMSTSPSTKASNDASACSEQARPGRQRLDHPQRHQVELGDGGDVALDLGYHAGGGRSVAVVVADRRPAAGSARRSSPKAGRRSRRSGCRARPPPRPAGGRGRRRVTGGRRPGPRHRAGEQLTAPAVDGLGPIGEDRLLEAVAVAEVVLHDTVVPLAGGDADLAERHAVGPRSENSRSAVRISRSRVARPPAFPSRWRCDPSDTVLNPLTDARPQRTAFRSRSSATVSFS